MTTGDTQMSIEQVCQAVMPQSSPLCGWKERTGGLALAFSQPTAQHGDRLFTKGRASGLAAFTHTPYVRTGARDDVLAVQADDFRGAQSRLYGQEQQRTIAPPPPSTEVWCREQCLDFHWREKGDGTTHVTLAGDGEHALRHGAVFRGLPGDVAKERMNGGQA